MVLRIYSLKFTEIYPAISLIVPYKALPFNEIIIKRTSFFSISISTIQTFVGLREPLGQILYLNIHGLSHNSLIFSWISIKFASVILLCMLYL